MLANNSFSVFSDTLDCVNYATASGRNGRIGIPGTSPFLYNTVSSCIALSSPYLHYY